VVGGGGMEDCLAGESLTENDMMGEEEGCWLPLEAVWVVFPLELNAMCKTQVSTSQSHDISVTQYALIGRSLTVFINKSLDVVLQDSVGQTKHNST